MNQNSQCEQLIDYFNGHLSDTEKHEFEKHLKECPECQEELAEFETLNADLIHGIEMVEPPAGMSNRILENIFSEDDKQSSLNESTSKQQPINNSKKNRNYKIWILPLAAALLLSVLGNIYLYSAQPESNTVSQSLFDDSQSMPLNPVSEELNMDARMAMHSDDNGQTLLLEAHNFTNHNVGDVYQIWLINDDKPYRAGTLVPNDQGEGFVVFSLENGDATDWDAVAITLEQSPHSTTPEGDILMSADF